MAEPGESPEELAAWSAELGEKGDAAATALQSRMRAKQAKKEVDELRKKLADAENTAMVAADAAEGSSAAGDGESPEELAKWTEGLGEKGNSAATKMQARQRAKQAKKEVDELRKKLADAQAEETTAVDKAVTDAAAAVDPDSPEELAKWTAELGDKGDAAATKMQAKMRAKQAKKEVAEIRAKIAEAEAAAAGSASADGGDGESPEELAKWTAELGAKGDAAATKMQARQRAKQARKEVEELKKQLTQAETKEETAVAEAVKAVEVDPESPEELAKWTAELGAAGDAAAAKMQARQRAKMAKKEVDALRAQLVAAEKEEEKAEEDGDSPESLAAWTAEMGERGDQAATALQSRMRAKQAKKEVAELRKQLADAAAAEQAAEAQAEAIPSSDESPEALAAWAAGLGAKGDAAATKMQSIQRGKAAKKEVDKKRQEKVGSTVRYPNPAEGIPEPTVPELQRILEKSVSTGKPFEDPRFPPAVSSLYTCEASLKSGEIDSFTRSPQILQKESPVNIFPDKKPCSDAPAHSLQSNWLKAAIAVISTRPDLLGRIFSNDLNSHWKQSGLLVLSLFYGFEWKSIALDSFIPSDLETNGAPPSELWAVYLEKAFAKMHTSYEAMVNYFDANGMTAYEAALVQMSGGVMERQTDPGAKLDFAKLQEKFFTGSLVSIYCKEKGNTFGLCPGCPYGILDMVEQQGFQLIRLRNPYGASGKWQGAIPFGKKTELRDKLGAHNKADDGTFWIHFKELVNLFDGGMISICRLFKQEYHQYAVLGNFEDARGSGPADPEFCSNPQYKLTINKPTTISVSLLQDTTLMATGGNAIAEQEPISLVMYKAKGQPILWEFPDEELCAVGTSYINNAQVNFEATIDPQSLSCSQFMLVPFQATTKPETGKLFCLRIFADSEVSIEKCAKLCKYQFPLEFTNQNSGGKRSKKIEVPVEEGGTSPTAAAGKAGETSAAAGGGGGATSSSAAAAAAGGPMQTVVVDNPAWGKNPQLVLGYKKPATVKVVIERIVGRKKPVGEIGATVCRLVPASQPDTTLQRVKKGRLPDESANSKAMNELDNKFLKRKLQILPNDWVKECPYVEDRSAVLCATTPVQGPLLVVPSLSEEGIIGNSMLTVYSDKEIYKHARLPDSQHPLICSEWTPDSAGGCHIYYPPYEPQKTATWGRNPQLFLKVPQRTKNAKITLARCEKSWRQKIVKDPVGCMLGFYLLKLVYDQHKQVVISRDILVYETTFSASHEIALNVPLDAGFYTILPCTYDPGKCGEFVVYVSTEDEELTMELSSRPFAIE